MAKTDKQHALEFNFLIGKTIKYIRYMTSKESENFGYYKRPLIIYFDDNSILIPQSDDEGNDGGSMWHSGKVPDQQTVFPVLETRDLGKLGVR